MAIFDHDKTTKTAEVCSVILPLKKIKSALLSKTEDETDEETQKSLIECSLGVELTTKEVCKEQSRTQCNERIFDKVTNPFNKAYTG